MEIIVPAISVSWFIAAIVALCLTIWLAYISIHIFKQKNALTKPIAWFSLLATVVFAVATALIAIHMGPGADFPDTAAEEGGITSITATGELADDDDEMRTCWSWDHASVGNYTWKTRDGETQKGYITKSAPENGACTYNFVAR